MRKYRVGSLFAGVGGICQGFKDASCDVLWANEIDEHSRKTYKINHPDVSLTSKLDVRVLTKDDVEKVDILAAGFPCQPFSQAGQARGFDDNRGQLFFEITRLLSELKPKAFFLENVKTLATHDGGKSLAIIEGALRKVGYSFISFVLRASEHTDIPQGRSRIYMVGFRGESSFVRSNETDFSEFYDSMPTPMSSSFRIPSPFNSKPKHFTEFLDGTTVRPEDFYDKPNNKIHERVREAVVDETKVYQYRRWFVRENKSDVCPTLTANMGLGGHNIPIILDGKLPRRLTPKECFNLQGFPPHFQMPSDVARVQLYRQCGNSVVVPLVRRIAEEIVRVLDENRNS